MTWLVNELNRRILFLRQEQQPNATTGGARQVYRQLVKVWAGVKELSPGAANYVRNVQTGDAPTHKFTVRRSVPAGVDTYGEGVVKADNFVYLMSSANVGRLFRITSAANIGEADEYLQFYAKEMGQIDVKQGIIQ